MTVDLPEALAFVHQSSFQDLDAIRKAFVLRVRHLQREGVRPFALNERVLFVKNGAEQPALVIAVRRNTLSVCLGDGRHIRCDASFLRKIPASPEIAHPEYASTAR